MDESEQPAGRFVWTRPQRRVLILLLLVLCIFFAIQYWRHPAHISDPQPPHGARYDEVADRIDPNTADLATLSALPVLGPHKAQDLIDFRESHRVGAAAATQPVFTRAEDLFKIKGFGYATVETLRPFLIFPGEDRPASRP
jgi:hypothetical protein